MTELQKLPQESKDMTADNIEKLSSIFPNCITEVKDKDGNVKKSVNFDVLKQMMSSNLIEGSERYEFTWPGKNAAILEANTPIRKTLRPCVEESKDWENTQNLYIEGDNLDALKLLQESYLGKIKMIYIDPPYNTGNDFIYKDNFHQSEDDYDEESGSINEDGYRMYKNSDSLGRFHSNWCSMIYPRLLLARNLLTDDGVIFMSIDENEFDNLQKISDEVFGRANFICQMIWAGGRKNDSKFISVSHEYVLIYAKNLNNLIENKQLWREKKAGLDEIYSKYDSLKKEYIDDYELMTTQLKKWYKTLPEGHPAKEHSHYCKIDQNGIYFPDNISWPGGGGPKYTILHPITQKPVKTPSRGWITNETTMQEWIKQGKVEFAETEEGVPTYKAYLKDREFSVPYSVIYKDGRAASKRLKELMGEKIFENPKDEEIIAKFLNFVGLKDNDLILDFFSGSGTTGHATWLSNLQNHNKKKFILVQIPEVIDERKSTSNKAKKVALNAKELLQKLGKQNNICELAKERLRRSGDLIKQGNPTLDVGFRVLKVSNSNMKDVYYNPEVLSQDLLSSLESNVKEDRSDLDLLFGTLLDFGLTLDKQIKEEVIDGKKILIYNDDAEEGADLIACFEDNISEELIKEIAKRKPSKAVFKDSSFANSPVKINLFEIFKLYAEIDADELPFRVKVI